MTWVLLTAAVFTAATWLVERWRYRQQLLHGDWIALPLWMVPLTLLLALTLVWSGVVIGGRFRQAGDVLECAEHQQVRGLYVIRATDQLLMDFTGMATHD